MKKFKISYLFCFIFCLFAFAACQDNNNRQNETEAGEIETEDVDLRDEQTMNRDNTVTGRIQDDQELSTFSGGMTRADLSDDFSEGAGPYTIFAPSDTAYEGLSPEEIGDTTNIQQLGANTSYLVVERRLTVDSLRQSINNVGGNLELLTMQGEQLMASLDGDNIVLRDGSGNTATIIQSDRNASNGVVHVIDRVLRPKDITRNDAADLMGVDTNNQSNMNNQQTNRSRDTNNSGNNQ